MKITQNQKLILELTSEALFEQNTLVPLHLSEELFHEAYMQAVLPLIYNIAGNHGYTENYEKWNNIQRRIFANNMRVSYEHTEVHDLLTSNHIPYVILKGTASASYYSEPLLRTMGDVDFLVNPCDLERAKKVLEAAGFKGVNDNDSQTQIEYHRDNSVWEIHWDPNGIPAGEAGKSVRNYLSDLIEQAVFYETQDGRFFMPSKFHHGLIMLLHMATHFINTGIGLRHLCDWAVFVNKISDKEFAALFEEKLKHCGLWRFAQLMTLLSMKYLHCQNCSWAETADDSLLESIMADIFAGGNFGKKDAERINQAKLITNAEKATVDDTSIIKQLIFTMNEKARIWLPIIKKYPILLPVGWLYVGCRHLLRVKEGKRPSIHIKNMVEGANERKEIYKEFRLFMRQK